MTGPLDIKLQGLSVRYGEKTVVDGVNLHLVPGEMVGLIGPNGAGKTSLLRALLGLADVTGSITIGDRYFADMATKERARLFAYLAQGGTVRWPLSVESLVALGRLPHKTPWQQLSDGDRLHIEVAMKATGVEGFRDRIVTHLSGGERARVLLARALAAKAPYLLADEPAAALDPHYQLDMMALLKAHVTDATGAIVVMHDLNLAQQFCDRLLVINDGKLVADGPPNDVLTDILLADVFSIQAARWSDDEESFLVPKTVTGA